MKQSMIYAAALLLGCLLAIGMPNDDLWYWIAGPTAPEPRPEPAGQHATPASVSMETLVARMEALQVGLTGVQGRVQALERARDDATITQHAQPSVAPLQEVPYPAEQTPPPDDEDDPDARYHQMQDLLARQTPDPAWEITAATDIATMFERAAPAGTVLENIACVGRICRLDLHHGAGATLDDLLLADGLAPWPHRGVAHALDAERSVLFLVSEEG